MKGFIISLGYYLEGRERDTLKTYVGQSYFKNIFNDILDDIGQLYWAVTEPNSPFNSSYARDESEMEFYYSELTEEYEKNLEFDLVSPPYSIFPKYARWIRDNDTTLLGFHNRPDESLVKRLIEDGYTDYFNVFDMFFNNDDGAFWECFARDESLLDRALDSALRVVERRFITLLDSDDRKESSYYWKEL